MKSAAPNQTPYFRWKGNTLQFPPNNLLPTTFLATSFPENAPWPHEQLQLPKLRQWGPPHIISSLHMFFEANLACRAGPLYNCPVLTINFLSNLPFSVRHSSSLLSNKGTLWTESGTRQKHQHFFRLQFIREFAKCCVVLPSLAESISSIKHGYMCVQTDKGYNVCIEHWISEVRCQAAMVSLCRSAFARWNFELYYVLWSFQPRSGVVLFHASGKSNGATAIAKSS